MTDRVLLTARQALRLGVLAGIGAFVIEVRVTRRLFRDWRAK